MRIYPHRVLYHVPVIKLFNIYIQTTTQLVFMYLCIYEWIYAKDLTRIVHFVTKKHLSLRKIISNHISYVCMCKYNIVHAAPINVYTFQMA